MNSTIERIDVLRQFGALVNPAKAEQTTPASKAVLLTQASAGYTVQSPHAALRCQNCRWFSDQPDTMPCHLVVNAPLTIVANGYCDRYEMIPDGSTVNAWVTDVSPDNPNTTKAINTDQPQDYCIMLQIGARPELVQIQDIVKGMLNYPTGNWLDPATFHVTLVYAPQSFLATIQDSLPLNPGAFSILMDGVGQFETPDGYAIHLTVRKEGALPAIQAALAQSVRDNGGDISPFSENDAYTPHITLGYSPTPITPFTLTPFALAMDELVLSDGSEQIVLQQALKATKSAADVSAMSLPDGLDDDEQDTYARIYEKVLALTGDVLKATLAAYGAINRLRYGLAVKAKKSVAPMPTGSQVSAMKSGEQLIVKGWGVLFGDKAHRDLDTPATYFAEDTAYLLDYYAHAPLWHNHGDSPLQWTPIGQRTYTEYVAGHGIWVEHALHTECPPEIIAQIERGELAYSSDSIRHYVAAGYQPEDGKLSAWPLVGVSVVDSPAEVGLGPVIL